MLHTYWTQAQRRLGRHTMDARRPSDTLFFAESDSSFFEYDICANYWWVLIGIHRIGGGGCQEAAQAPTQARALALPLAAGPLASRICGARNGNGQAYANTACKQSMNIASTTLCACVLLQAAAGSTSCWLSYDCGALGVPCKAKPTLIWSKSKKVPFTAQGACALHALVC